MVRGLVRRIVVMPRDEDEPQGLEIEAGFSPVQVSTERYCTGGCGGMQHAMQRGHSVRGQRVGNFLIEFGNCMWLPKVKLTIDQPVAVTARRC